MYSYFERSGVSQGPTAGLTQWAPRKWHLQPWKRSTLMDALGDDEGEDVGDTNYADVLNSTVQTIGNVMVARNNPNAFVARPKPGQVVPNAPMASMLGLSTTQMMMAGGAVLLGLFLFKGRK